MDKKDKKRYEMKVWFDHEPFDTVICETEQEAMDYVMNNAVDYLLVAKIERIKEITD